MWPKVSAITNLHVFFNNKPLAGSETPQTRSVEVYPEKTWPQNGKIIILNSNESFFLCKGLQPRRLLVHQPSPGTIAPTRHRTIPWKFKKRNMFVTNSGFSVG